jgi:hypothetical protein
MRDAVRSTLRLWSVLAVLFLSYWMFPGLAGSQESVAEVLALQGVADANQVGSPNMTKLDKGSQIEPFMTISTGAKSKLVLRWQNGMISTLGESSSISSRSENGEGPVSKIQMISGVARFTIDGKGNDSSLAYTVESPTMSVRPDAVERSADYALEIPDPSTTILTVFSGKVRAGDRTNGAREDTLYESCRTVDFTKGKTPRVTTADTYDLIRLADRIMIAGALPVMDTCPSGLAQGRAPAASNVIVGMRTFGLGD